MSKLNKTKKNKIRMYDNYYSDELISIFTADSILSDVYLGKCHISHAYKTTKRRNIEPNLKITPPSLSGTDLKIA